MENMYKTLYEREIQKQRAKRKLEISHRKQARRRNLVIFGFVAIIIFAAIASFNRQDNYHFEETTIHIVEQGDTLWSIARQHSDNRHDVRQVIWIIQQLNDTTAMIFPRQVLEIPVFTILAE